MTGYSRFQPIRFWLALALFFFLALVPVLYILLNLAGAVDAHALVGEHESEWAHLFSSQARILFFRTVRLGIQTSLISLLLAGVPAWFLARYRFGGRRLIVALLLTPVFIPPYLHAIMWTYMFGRKGVINQWIQNWGLRPWLVTGPDIGGTALVQALAFYPFLFLLLYRAFGRLDRSIGDSLRLYLGRAFIGHEFRSLLPTLLIGLFLIFILSITNFGIPQVLLVQVYSLEIFTQYSAFLNYRAATLVSLPQVFIGFVILAVILFLERRYPVNEKSMHPPPVSSGRSGFLLGFLWSVALIVVAILIPVTLLFNATNGMASFQYAARYAGKELFTSLKIAVVSATTITILALWIARGLRGIRRPWAYRGILFLSLCPLVIPGILLATGMTRLWVRFDWIYLSLWILVFASTARFLPLAILFLNAAIAQVNENATGAALLAGGNRLEQKVVHRWLGPELGCVWILAFTLAYGELDASVLVKNPENMPVAPLLVSLLHFSPPDSIAAISLIALAFGLVPVLVYFLIFDRILDMGSQALQRRSH